MTKSSRPPKIHFLVDEMKEAEDTLGEQLLLLSGVSFAALSRLAEIVSWVPTRWLGDDRQEAQRLASKVFKELSNPMSLQSVLDELHEIQELIKNLNTTNSIDINCCSNLEHDEPSYGPPLEPGEGDPPSHWGDEETPDWAEYNKYLCGAAWSYVEHLVSNARKMQVYVSLGAVTMTIIAAVLGVLSGAGLLIVISYASAAAVVSGLAQVAGTQLFAESADDIETYAEDIVCSIMGKGVPLRTAVMDAVGPTAWSIFYRFVNYENALYILRSGKLGDKVLPAVPRTDCECQEPEFYINKLFTYDTNTESWSISSRAGWVSENGGAIFHHPKQNVNPHPTSQWISAGTLCTVAGKPQVPIRLIKCSLYGKRMALYDGWLNGRQVRFVAYYTDGTNEVSAWWNTPEERHEFVPSQQKTLSSLYVQAHSGGSGANGQIQLDDVIVVAETV